MKAARFYIAGDVRIEDIDGPTERLGRHELLIHNRACGICGTDLHEYRHGPVYTFREPHPLTGAMLPQILGHEFSGVVEAVGSDVRNAKVGDRVAIMPQVFCGRCEQCMAGRQQCCVDIAAIGLSWRWGGLGEYAIVHEPHVATLPESVSDAAGALVEPAAVAVHSVASAPVRPGDVVLVTGGGPIGQLVALAALAAGAGAVFLSEPNRARRGSAAALGLTGVIDPIGADVAERLAAETNGSGADVCIECSGSQAGLDASLASVKRGGTVTQTALHERPVQLDATAHLTLRDVTLKGVYCYPVTSWPRVIRMIASGRLPVERIVTAQIALDDVVEKGFEALLDPNGSEVKVLVSHPRA
jgi:(R,R)-butanediol dehydrogenase/meso-butanediol dehydrogenase/diacetyl reductase